MKKKVVLGQCCCSVSTLPLMVYEQRCYNNVGHLVGESECSTWGGMCTMLKASIYKHSSYPNMEGSGHWDNTCRKPICCLYSSGTGWRAEKECWDGIFVVSIIYSVHTQQLNHTDFQEVQKLSWKT